MVCSRVVLGRVVGQIVFFWFPEDVKLALGCAVFEPIGTNVYGFGSFLFNSSCEDATGGNIVRFQWSWWLWVAQFDEALSDGQCFPCGEVKCSNFSFGC